MSAPPAFHFVTILAHGPKALACVSSGDKTMGAQKIAQRCKRTMPTISCQANAHAMGREKQPRIEAVQWHPRSATIPATPSSGTLAMNMLIRRSILRTVVALGAATAFHAVASLPAERVSLDAARSDAEAGRALLVDIREPHEHATGVSRVAKLLPMSEISARMAEIPQDPTKPVLLICNTQNRSRAVWQALRERGYTNVRYVEGGMSEWARRGLPLVKPVMR